jgi:hypothetical protein
LFLHLELFAARQNPAMHAVLALLFLFGSVVMLVLGLFSVLRYLAGTSMHDEPAFREIGTGNSIRRRGPAR